jgi:hypothetical protein
MRWEYVGIKECPQKREMHATSYHHNKMIICGGRNESGILHDFWTLTLTSHRHIVPPVNGFMTTTGDVFEWSHEEKLIQEGICSHAIVYFDANVYLFGGFNGIGVSNMLQYCNLQQIEPKWVDIQLVGDIPPKFGHAAILAPYGDGVVLIVAGGMSLDPDDNSTLIIKVPTTIA